MYADMSVTEATVVDDELLAAIGALTTELSPTTLPPAADDLSAIIESPCTTLLIARDASQGQIVGMLTLAIFRIPTGVRAWIEDVVVNVSARGKGAGKALCREALVIAWRHGARTVDLTSRPSRKEANRLYQRLGFARRETNVYRIRQGDLFDSTIESAKDAHD